MWARSRAAHRCHRHVVLTMKKIPAGIRRIKFTSSRTRGGRIHYLTPDDIRVLLSRLPEELWERLRAVHFNDQSRGARCAGYVNMGHREIAICAFPASVSCTPFSSRQWKTPSPATFGALRGRQWPRLAVRRFLLYDTFLHELGHLQIVVPSAKTVRRRFASEPLARQFANRWRRALWAEHFDHPDPVHNPPVREESTSVSSAEISDAGLEHLQGLKQLERLYLRRTKVSKEGVSKLQQALPQCKIDI